ncbi:MULTISPECIES: cation diffusion facilitator family transporter [Giesbergeria]|uniref:Cation diffusion facilitator family transporter n=1 Tax=Giesbergeria sinuosa TaxID=80883 RepID=A0ABV9QK63_9BURK
MGAAHSHSSHSHAPANFSRAFAIGIALNLAFVAIEAFYGWSINSLALLADAGHNLSDVAGLVLAWAGAWAAKLRPNNRHTYGWKRGSIVAAVLNALLLLLAMGALAWEAIDRLGTPQATEGWAIIAVAGVGIVINTATALLFMRGRATDLNIRGAFLHMVADALVSLGVVLGGGLYLWQGWSWIDPVMSLAIAVVIVWGTWDLLRQSVHLLLDGVPERIDTTAVRQHLLALPGVTDVHDLHVWALGTSEVALSAHVVLQSSQTDVTTILHQAEHLLHTHFDIHHATLQVEPPAYAQCCNLRVGVGGCCGV